MASGTGPPAAIVLLAAARFSANEDAMTVCAPSPGEVGRDFAADATTATSDDRHLIGKLP